MRGDLCISYLVMVAMDQNRDHYSLFLITNLSSTSGYGSTNICVQSIWCSLLLPLKISIPGEQDALFF